MPQRVLVVEDDDILRYAMSRELAAAGYEVSEAHDYRDALEFLEGHSRFVLLVIDLVLPGVNGFALARMARMRQPNIKTVYMTAFENIPMNEAAGPVLHKPVATEVLLTTIRDVIGRRDPSSVAVA